MTAAGEAAASVASRSSATSVVLPRTTRMIAGMVMAGVLVQAVLAGGLLAGRGLVGSLHEPVGHMLTLMAVLPLFLGLVGRWRTKEPGRVVGYRAGLAAMAVTAMLLGMLAVAGTRDLLMLHIPVAIMTMGFAAQLIGAVNDTTT